MNNIETKNSENSGVTATIRIFANDDEIESLLSRRLCKPISDYVAAGFSIEIAEKASDIGVEVQMLKQLLRA